MMLGSACREKTVRKLFSRNSDACDHNPATLQTDGRTDGETVNLPWRNRAIRYASRGKKTYNYVVCQLAVSLTGATECFETVFHLD